MSNINYIDLNHDDYYFDTKINFSPLSDSPIIQRLEKENYRKKKYTGKRKIYSNKINVSLRRTLTN